MQNINNYALALGRAYQFDFTKCSNVSVLYLFISIYMCVNANSFFQKSVQVYCSRSTDVNVGKHDAKGDDDDCDDSN